MQWQKLKEIKNEPMENIFTYSDHTFNKKNQMTSFKTLKSCVCFQKMVKPLHIHVTTYLNIQSIYNTYFTM